MKIVTSLVILIAMAVLVLAEPPPHKPGEFTQATPPIGLLGYPIGTYLTIEGIGADTNKYHSHCLLVDKIGDYKLLQAFPIYTKNVEPLQGERCVLRGFESGAWSGSPPGVVEAVSSKPWSFDFFFIATFIEQPPALKLQRP